MALGSSSSDSDIRKGLLLHSHHRTETIKGGWHAAIFIICTEFAEQFSYLGLSANLITYLTNEIHQPITEATKNVNTWLGFSSLFPLLGGFIADSYLGRFNTVLISSFIYLLPPRNNFATVAYNGVAKRFAAVFHNRLTAAKYKLVNRALP
ncbi:hypothetical protein PIB30_005492 [Stylosanthes scabra]|uniref:Uncharacterized protein n=1 Tax=Stylosanthes scabra TaxID=79078 RepID=A0ABU6Z3R6_9FABA|nr:hypothetical protein [Stylosanthes scabra]